MSDVKRSFPQSIEAERALLCSLVLDSSKILDVLEIIDSGDFYDERHSIIFEVLKHLHAKGFPFDFVIVTETLKEKGELEKVGGLSYLTSLFEHLPAPGNARYYAEIIHKKAVLRELIHTANEIAEIAYEEPEDIDIIIDFAEKSIFDISSRKSTGYTSVESMLDETLNYLEALRKRDSVLTGIPTGFADLDEKTSGFQRGDLIIIAGRPSMGKTSLAINIALNASLQHGISTGIFSLEMTSRQLILRMLSSVSGIEFSKIRTGFIRNTEWDSLIKALDKLKRTRIYIDDSSLSTVTDIRTRLRKMKLEKEIDMAIIDYLQLIQGNTTKNRTQELSEISRALKILAKEMDIPIVALSQLNRGVELREDKRPVMADLRDSGAIEQDADLIMFIYRDEVYHKNKEENKNIAEIIIGKQRNGPMGTVKLVFQKETTTFKDMVKPDFVYTTTT